MSAQYSSTIGTDHMHEREITLKHVMGPVVLLFVLSADWVCGGTVAYLRTTETVLTFGEVTGRASTLATYLSGQGEDSDERAESMDANGVEIITRHVVTFTGDTQPAAALIVQMAQMIADLYTSPVIPQVMDQLDRITDINTGEVEVKVMRDSRDLAAEMASPGEIDWDAIDWDQE